MKTDHNSLRNQAHAPSPEPRTFCRIVGRETGPDGKGQLILEPITDPQEQAAAQKRYEAAMRKAFERVLKTNSTRLGNCGRRET